MALPASEPRADALTAEPSYDALLHEEVARYYADPLGFVLAMYPWREPGTILEQEDGPDTWQREALERIGREIIDRGFDGVAAVPPVRMAVSSGHGIGKSALTAWLVDWIMSTRPYCQGSISAGTIGQLQTKTWAAIQKWTKLCRTVGWFEINSDRMYRKGYRESWFCAPQSSKEDNSESFAGQHAKNSSSFYIFDEASQIPEKIWEVAEGGLTDGEPFVLVFGNPTRSQGAFYRACFGDMRKRWQAVIVDSRTSKLSNKALIQEWADDYGEDSDFFRVRVKGLPPAASDLQYIDSARVFAAQQRTHEALPDDPLVCGLDVARGGGDDNVFRFRRGVDAATIPPIRVPGEQTRDTMRLVALATDLLNRDFDGQRIAMMFVDGTGIGGPIYDRLCQLGYASRVTEIQFGWASPDPKFANMRAFMWGRCREWLSRGRIDSDPQLEQDLTAPGFTHDRQDRILLESKEQLKKRGIDSPDDADALCLTFAAPVMQTAATDAAKQFDHGFGGGDGGWMG